MYGYTDVHILCFVLFFLQFHYSTSISQFDASLLIDYCQFGYPTVLYMHVWFCTKIHPLFFLLLIMCVYIIIIFSLKKVLECSLGIVGVVKKKRTLFMVERTRIHVDDVEKLGHFMELEVIVYQNNLDFSLTFQMHYYCCFRYIIIVRLLLYQIHYCCQMPINP